MLNGATDGRITLDCGKQTIDATWSDDYPYQVRFTLEDDADGSRSSPRSHPTGASWL